MDASDINQRKCCQFIVIVRLRGAQVPSKRHHYGHNGNRTNQNTDKIEQ